MNTVYEKSMADGNVITHCQQRDYADEIFKSWFLSVASSEKHTHVVHAYIMDVDAHASADNIITI